VVRTAHQLDQAGAPVSQDGAKRAAHEWLRFPRVTLDHLDINLSAHDPALVEELVLDARYAPYLERQAAEIDSMAKSASTYLPPDLSYTAIAGLSNEMVERLDAARPATLGDASRVRGITPAAITAILLHLRRAA
jgi:tRNA uridine 5-carboxymethylaminomethyl modification enzyme